MNWRLIWYKATHWHRVGRDWLFAVGNTMWDSDWGITFNRGLLPPNSFSGDYKRWRVEWRVNLRWPISIRRRVSR